MPHTWRAPKAPPRAAAACSAVPEALMSGLAQHAARVEDMKNRGAFTMAGHIEEVNGDGKPKERKEVVLRSTPTRVPMDRDIKVIRYIEDGKDKTFDLQVRATERRVKRLGDPAKQAEDRKTDLKLPFLESEQARYVFSIAERNAAQPARVRIAFSPKVPAENAIKGSAWVDEVAREVLSLGFSFSKNPAFVDHVDVTVTFGLPDGARSRAIAGRLRRPGRLPLHPEALPRGGHDLGAERRFLTTKRAQGVRSRTSIGPLLVTILRTSVLATASSGANGRRLSSARESTSRSPQAAIPIARPLRSVAVADARSESRLAIATRTSRSLPGVNASSPRRRSLAPRGSGSKRVVSPTGTKWRASPRSQRGSKPASSGRSVASVVSDSSSGVLPSAMSR